MCVEYYYIDAFLKRFSTKFSKNLVIWKKNIRTNFKNFFCLFKQSWNDLGTNPHIVYGKSFRFSWKWFFPRISQSKEKRSRKFSKFFSHAQISPISIVDFFPQKRKGGTVSRIDNRPFRTSVTRVPFGHPRRWLAFYDSLRFPSRLSACKRHRSDWFTSHEILSLQ